MRHVFRALRPALCLIVVSCASAGGGAPGSSPAVAQRRSDRTIISADEIAANHETTLYDLVRSLRVEWLTSRGAAASSPGLGSSGGSGGRSRSTGSPSGGGQGVTPLQVYMNRQRVGGVDELKNMSPVGIASLKYYAPTEAQAMFGTGNDSGVIQVIPATGGGKPD